MSAEVVYDDGQVTLWHGDVRNLDVPGGSGAAVVTSPPYNVGLAYDGVSDVLAWADYWQLAAEVAWVMYRTLMPGGRVWVNTAVSVPWAVPQGGEVEGPGKARVMLAHGWHRALADAGLSVVDQVAWCSPRGAGTAWGSWASPAAPNLRGDYEAVTMACKGAWERSAPEGFEGWRDGVGGWPGLCSTVWNLTPACRDGHPAPFPVELARRCIRLSTWPGEMIFDPFAGSGTTLLAARQLGRRAIGVEASAAYCELAARRLGQGELPFHGAA
ncbi:MAG TPA: site-specific DNA-methyltransferase [Acidimicrobiales bacterium]